MRTSGILLHISSLPSPYGIGTLGKEAFRFVDFLADSGQAYWQILPLGPTSYGDSPYQSYSTFAGNPYFIDLDSLCEEGLLPREELDSVAWFGHPEYIDYDRQYQHRFSFLHKAFAADDPQHSQEYWNFLDQNHDWLDDYCLFMSVKGLFDGKPWTEWEDDIRLRDPLAMARYTASCAEEMNFWRWVQFRFARQWNALKTYAATKNVRFIGDVPFYVALDSADVWAGKELFQLDDDCRPTAVAGCPPDAFSATGQLWGNPLYRWDFHRSTDYAWWRRRIQAAERWYDRIRIDHFRGFDAFYAIPYGDETAANGTWTPGPGLDFFVSIRRALGDVDIIAEDLGLLTDSVHVLLEQSGYPGMKVLQFAFDNSHRSTYLPHSHVKNGVVYTGTHDNNTLRGWFESAPESEIAFCKTYLRLNEAEGFHWGFLRAAWGSVADTMIAPLQDFLWLGAEARMNTPSTLGDNWKWRLKPDALTPELAGKLREMTDTYARL